MKIIFLLIFTFLIVACDDNNENNDSELIGKWSIMSIVTNNSMQLLPYPNDAHEQYLEFTTDGYCSNNCNMAGQYTLSNDKLILTIKRVTEKLCGSGSFHDWEEFIENDLNGTMNYDIDGTILSIKSNKGSFYNFIKIS